MAKKASFRRMREVAAQLPVQFTESKMSMKGSKILETAPDAKDGSGNPIDPEKWYEAPARQSVNHYRRIKRLFKSGSYKAVADYINQVADLEIGAALQHQQLMASMPAQPMSI